MKETVEIEFGFRKPNGNVVGWWRTRQARDYGVAQHFEDVRKVGLADGYRVQLVKRRKRLIYDHHEIERSVKAA